jgi:hypothetical protein
MLLIARLATTTSNDADAGALGALIAARAYDLALPG